jgi:anti-sigma B factor antagonist
MKIQRQNGTLTVHDVQELSAANARSFRNEICAALSPGLKTVEIDLSQISFVDSCGVGALASLYKAANDQSREAVIAVRLLHPQPPVQQMLELTRMHHIFEIVPRNAEPE